jgi:hypothetical protein
MRTSTPSLITLADRAGHTFFGAVDEFDAPGRFSGRILSRGYNRIVMDDR